MSNLLDRTVVVLCRPEESGNIGSVCRAMKTMGIETLRIVGAGNIDERVVEYMSVHAFEVYRRAERFNDLAAALGDLALTAGVTRRRGKRRKTVSLLPEEFADAAAGVSRGSVGLVFGNERDGLSDAELAECALAVHIPSAPAFPSLNLSHAVQIVCYAMLRCARPEQRFTPVPRERIVAVTKTAIDAMDDLGFFTPAGSSITTEFLRDVLSRARLSKTEADRVEKMFWKIRNIAVRRKPEI